MPSTFNFRSLPIAFKSSVFSNVQEMVDLMSDVIEDIQSGVESNYQKGVEEGTLLKTLLKKNKMVVKVKKILHLNIPHRNNIPFYV